MCARGNPTGWSTGVRSAGVAAITSHHSLYWPPPIGFLLNLKRMQLFLLGGSNLKARTELLPYIIKRQLEGLLRQCPHIFLISFTGRLVSWE